METIHANGPGTQVHSSTGTSEQSSGGNGNSTHEYTHQSGTDDRGYSHGEYAGNEKALEEAVKSGDEHRS